MTIIQLAFFTMAEKEPPFDKPLLCRIERGFVILRYINTFNMSLTDIDLGHGKLFTGLEGYIGRTAILWWAELTNNVNLI